MNRALENGRAFHSKNLLIHERFEGQAAKLLDKTAIVVDNEALTYGQLSDKSNQLALYLKSLGIKRHELIGLFMERSVDVVIGILAILKSGCAYVPFDPRYPQERILYMLQDAKISVLLTQEKLVSSIPTTVYLNPSMVVNVNCIYGSEFKAKKIASESVPSDLACVIYTSGTTGKPKGVMTTHANICSYVNGLSDRLQISNDDKYLHTASIAFSSSNRQLLLPLLSGSTVVMATPEDRLNPLLLFKLIQSQGISIIDLVPTHMKNCINVLNRLEEKERHSLLDNKLRMVLSASEALFSNIPEEWRKLFRRDIKYVNMYGLTETSGIIATYEIYPHCDEKPMIEPIGCPLNDINVYILDRDMKPVTGNDAGLLYISGPQLTRGYLDKTELTRELFLEDPFNLNQGSVLFKTGDLCRYNSDGNIEYVGRDDDQIKVSGIRIEPREIELVLNMHPDIQDSIVGLKEFHGEKRLVAYFVPSGNKHLSVTELREFLKKELPEHMIPSYFIAQTSLPMTPNGKLDRLSLPELSWNMISQDSSIQEPRNEIERWLSDVWKEILHIDVLGINQDFFELGGTSLLAFQITARIYDKFNINLAASVMLDNSTIASLSKYIQDICNSGQNLFHTKERRKKGVI